MPIADSRVGIKVLFSWTHRTLNISKNISLYHDRIDLLGLLWDTLFFKQSEKDVKGSGGKSLSIWFLDFVAEVTNLLARDVFCCLYNPSTGRLNSHWSLKTKFESPFTGSFLCCHQIEYFFILSINFCLGRNPLMQKSTVRVRCSDLAVWCSFSFRWCSCFFLHQLISTLY